MAKPKFEPLNRDCHRLEPITYTPIIFICGTETHRLALHREIGLMRPSDSEWRISDPISGASIGRVRASYKGMPIASNRLTIAQARNCAMITLEEICEMRGSDEFNSKLRWAREKWGARTRPSGRRAAPVAPG